MIDSVIDFDRKDEHIWDLGGLERRTPAEEVFEGSYDVATDSCCGLRGSSVVLLYREWSKSFEKK